MKKEDIKNWERLYSAISGVKMVGVFEGFESLTPREQRILSMRFGLMNNLTATLEETAKTFGVTRERIRQLEAKGLEKLRQRIN